jgi:hypothetical protein
MIQLSRLATIVPGVGGTPPIATFTRFALVDRGSYEHATVDAPPALVALASQVTSRALRPVSARLLRLSRGDYLLAHHDSLHADHRVEVILDLSPAAVPGAAVHYRRRGQVFFVVPSTPGAASIVERDPTTQVYHTYISKLHAGASVVRLVVQLSDG